MVVEENDNDQPPQDAVKSISRFSNSVFFLLSFSLRILFLLVVVRLFNEQIHCRRHDSIDARPYHVSTRLCKHFNAKTCKVLSSEWNRLNATAIMATRTETVEPNEKERMTSKIWPWICVRAKGSECAWNTFFHRRHILCGCGRFKMKIIVMHVLVWMRTIKTEIYDRR